MIRTIEAFVDEDGTVRLLEDVRLSAPQRALVTIFEEEPAVDGSELDDAAERVAGVRRPAPPPRQIDA